MTGAMPAASIRSWVGRTARSVPAPFARRDWTVAAAPRELLVPRRKPGPSFPSGLRLSPGIRRGLSHSQPLAAASAPRGQILLDAVEEGGGRPVEVIHLDLWPVNLAGAASSVHPDL